MALIKIKQVLDLQTNLDNLANATTDLSVDSKDASVLAAANAALTGASIDSKDTSVLAAAESFATSSDVALSVDSKDASVLSAAGTALTGASIDSKDASVLVAAENYADAADTALSVDSKDASVLAAAQAYSDEKVNDDFRTHTIVIGAGITDVSGGTVGNLDSFTPGASTLDYTINANYVLSGSNVKEYEENIMYVSVNGVMQTSDAISLVTDSSFRLTVPFTWDDDDVVEVKYNWENSELE